MGIANYGEGLVAALSMDSVAKNRMGERRQN